MGRGRQAADLIGQKFTRLTVVGRAPNAESGNARWLCRCVCGELRHVAGSDLRSGQQKSCGCLAAERRWRRNHDRLRSQPMGPIDIHQLEELL